MLTLNATLSQTLLKNSNGALRRKPQESFLSGCKRWRNFKNKEKHEDFGMHFTDKQFKHNNTIALSFRKHASHKADGIAE